MFFSGMPNIVPVWNNAVIPNNSEPIRHSGGWANWHRLINPTFKSNSLATPVTYGVYIPRRVSRGQVIPLQAPQGAYYGTVILSP